MVIVTDASTVTMTMMNSPVMNVFLIFFSIDQRNPLNLFYAEAWRMKNERL